jgi:hypothetical protein
MVAPISFGQKVAAMVRASFFAFGFFIALCGVAFLNIDKFVMTGPHEDRAQGFRGMLTSPQTIEKETKDVLDPPEWAAFLMMSIGSVTMLYAAALPKRKD